VIKTEDKESYIDFTNRSRKYLYDFVPNWNGCFVSGGFFPRFYYDIPLRDIDIYTNSSMDYECFLGEFKNNRSYQLYNDASPTEFSTFYNEAENIYVDLIGFHSPRAVVFVNGFDFRLCSLHMSTSSLKPNTTNAEAFSDIQKKRLVYRCNAMAFESKKYAKNNSTIKRLIKYMELGFSPEGDIGKNIYDDIFSQGRAQGRDEARSDFLDADTIVASMRYTSLNPADSLRPLPAS
jgi:hypothetical protein